MWLKFVRSLLVFFLIAWVCPVPSLSDPLPQLSPNTTIVDTLEIYGGPDTLDGKFQTIEGAPDQQGWTTADGTASDLNIWNISTYNASNLTPGTPDNNAWWCGEMFPACEDDVEGGYGNNWISSLAWQGWVLDPALPAVVTVTGILNHDSEPGYDYLHLEFMTYGNQPNEVLVLDGRGEGLEFSESFTYGAFDYLGEYGNLEVRFTFHSDDAWSDEDCSYPSVGAAQIDNLQVTISQDGPPDIVSPVETCEPGDEVQWQNVPTPGYGNFAQVWEYLEDIDPEVDNFTPQWAFIDDGIIEPGTGGTTCRLDTGCYGPDNLVVDIWGGLNGELFPGLRNHVTSPALELPLLTGLPGEPNLAWEELYLAADVYMHSDPACGLLMGVGFDVQSTADQEGLTGWTSSSQAIVTYWADPAYERIELTFNRESLVPNAFYVRINFTAMDMRTAWCWTELYSTPAPYVDNIRLQAGMVDTSAPVPEAFAQNQVKVYPNPFNPKTVVSYSTAKDQRVKVGVYDIRGRLISELANGVHEAGPHTLEWKGRDSAGRTMPSGAYYFRVEMGDQVFTKKAMLVR